MTNDLSFSIDCKSTNETKWPKQNRACGELTGCFVSVPGDLGNWLGVWILCNIASKPHSCPWQSDLISGPFLNHRELSQVWKGHKLKPSSDNENSVRKKWVSLTLSRCDDVSLVHSQLVSRGVPGRAEVGATLTLSFEPRHLQRPVGTHSHIWRSQGWNIMPTSKLNNHSQKSELIAYRTQYSL